MQAQSFRCNATLHVSFVTFDDVYMITQVSELLSEKIELEDKLCQAQQDLQHLENKLQVQEVEFDVCIQTKWSIHEGPILISVT